MPPYGAVFYSIKRAMQPYLKARHNILRSSDKELWHCSTSIQIATSFNDCHLQPTTPLTSITARSHYCQTQKVGTLF
ncbi:Uncharacterised protein [Cardiobacterium valvarum]|uniref:Uncharacterized protein n=2 Tax=Cardiobacterium valvarum TaxID=194702 RepID=A0A381E7I3_9GAMM|nr:Uncharacterised protein [Cardiobacterium valvarum]